MTNEERTDATRIARKFLESRGFRIVEEGYHRKVGSVDIVSERDGTTHLAMVVPPTRGNPFGRLTPLSVRSFLRTARWYATERKAYGPFAVDAFSVSLGTEAGSPRLEFLWNVLETV